MGKKIATCNYCGTRAVLVFDAARHELTCSACGAPLHDMKFMPQAPEKQRKKPAKTQTPRGMQAAAATGLAGRSAWMASEKKSKKKKKRKPVFRRFLEEIIDEIEDIFD